MPTEPILKHNIHANIIEQKLFKINNDFEQLHVKKRLFDNKAEIYVYYQPILTPDFVQSDDDLYKPNKFHF